jgi:hypothetical protein
LTHLEDQTKNILLSLSNNNHDLGLDDEFTIENQMVIASLQNSSAFLTDSPKYNRNSFNNPNNSSNHQDQITKDNNTNGQPTYEKMELLERYTISLPADNITQQDIEDFIEKQNVECDIEELP